MNRVPGNRCAALFRALLVVVAVAPFAGPFVPVYLSAPAYVYAAAPLRLDAVLGADDGDESADGSAGRGFAHAESVRPFRFPRDHGPHPEFRTEWWYLTANLRGAGPAGESADGSLQGSRDEEGEEFGVQFTVFRQALRPPAADREPGSWDAGQLYLAHVAVTDVARARHLHAERLSRAHPRLAGAIAEPFRVHVDGWSLRTATRGFEALRLRAATADFAVELDLDPQKPIVLQGDRGLSPKGPGQASYYYTLPRLAAAGRIRIGDTVYPVQGQGWIDREWSTSVLSAAQTGWDWFSLQLDSGEELMVFQLRREDGERDPFDQGLWVDAEGRGHPLGRDAFELTPARVWHDERDVAWPVDWRLVVTLPDGVRRFSIEALLDDQRMDTLLTYWEGLVRIRDTEGVRTGTGYMELTGYE